MYIVMIAACFVHFKKSTLINHKKIYLLLEISRTLILILLSMILLFYLICV